MARKSSPHYYDSLKGYYVTIDKVRYELAKGEEKDPEVKAAAEKEFRRLMYMATVTISGNNVTCFQVMNKFIQYQENNFEPKTVRTTKFALKPFIKDFSELEVNKLSEELLTDWLLSKSTWGNSTKRIFLTKVKASINFAVNKLKILPKNPLGKIILPAAGSRSTDELITDEHHRLFVEMAAKRSNHCYMILLELLKETGARPAEIYLAKVSEWIPGLNQFIIKPQKGRGYKNYKTNKLRIINVPDRLVPLVKELIIKNKNGTLFHNEQGRIFSEDMIILRINYMKKVINETLLKEGGNIIPKCITHYSYRHAFATNWLMQGLSAHDLCQLIGTSMAMLEKHYSHVMSQQVHLREQMKKFQEGQKKTPSSEEVLSMKVI